MKQTTLDEKTRFFKALSDKNRLRILKMLQTKELCVCEITNILKLSTSTVSKHLSILRENEFILEKREGKWINYNINQHSSDQRVSAVLASLEFWIADDRVVNEDKLKVIKVDRNEVCSR